ncbi:hypothetical protein [Actinoplanes awajinensis]|uniref:Uncharacterized protein n=1 Tax=Actinoplanes awajinensis subsp. mycoplanecinus TaxID=135947 RepID=A0A117MR36_9ACTN|nr:hypothetical protein [Actinoplanes awajinensis]KUL31241.1 hypothetical protein ADL15_22575 [Actinoplanes awajinensis subsp. mycoplanecinus]
MGYDLHISRAIFDPYAERYPIAIEEVRLLVSRTPWLSMPNSTVIVPDDSDTLWMLYSGGLIYAKNPSDHLTRRMVEMAGLLDAWVTGDYGELYELHDGEIITREATPDERFGPSGRLTRRPGQPGITEQEWLRLVAEQPDFTLMTTITARLPSGPKQIPCPPVPCWTAHPSGQPIPFFYDDPDIQVHRPDPPIIRRMRDLATHLNARAVNDWDHDLTP